MGQFTLKFISGKYQGGEFPVPTNGELVLGRASDADIVLVEDMVSRRHTAIRITNNQLEVRDLGSTNGTFVNGQKLTAPTPLVVEDRLLVGTSVLCLLDGSQGALEGAADTEAQGTQRASADSAREEMALIAQRSASETSTMSGDLAEAPLADLLKLFAQKKRPGVVTLEGEPKGRIVLSAQGIHSAALMAEHPILPQKALARLLARTEGAFLFETTKEAPTTDADFTGPLEDVLGDAIKQMNETQRLLAQIGGPEVGLALMVPLVPALAELDKDELTVLQAAINKGSVGGVLDATSLADPDLLGTLAALVDARYLQSA